MGAGLYVGTPIASLAVAGGAKAKGAMDSPGSDESESLGSEDEEMSGDEDEYGYGSNEEEEITVQEMEEEEEAEEAASSDSDDDDDETATPSPSPSPEKLVLGKKRTASTVLNTPSPDRAQTPGEKPRVTTATRPTPVPRTVVRFAEPSNPTAPVRDLTGSSAVRRVAKVQPKALAPEAKTEREIVEAIEAAERIQGAGFVVSEEEEEAQIAIIKEHESQPARNVGLEVGQHFCYHSYLHLPRIVSAARLVPSDQVDPLILPGHRAPFGLDYVEYPSFAVSWAAEAGAYPAVGNFQSEAEAPGDRSAVCMYEMMRLSGSELVNIDAPIAEEFLGIFEQDFIAHSQQASEAELRTVLHKLVPRIMLRYQLQKGSLEQTLEINESVKRKLHSSETGGTIVKEDGFAAVALVTAMIELLNQAHAEGQRPQHVKQAMIVFLREMNQLLDLTPDVVFCMLVRLGKASDVFYWCSEVFGRDQMSDLVDALHNPGWEFVWQVADSYTFPHPLLMAAMRHDSSMMYFLLREFACHISCANEKQAGTTSEVILASAALNPQVDYYKAFRCLLMSGLCSGRVQYHPPSSSSPDKPLGHLSYGHFAKEVSRMLTDYKPPQYPGDSPESTHIGVPEYAMLWKALTRMGLPNDGTGNTLSEQARWMVEDFPARGYIPDYATNVLRVMHNASQGVFVAQSVAVAELPYRQFIPVTTESWRQYSVDAAAFWIELDKLTQEGKQRSAVDMGTQPFIDQANAIKQRFASLHIDADVDRVLKEITSRITKLRRRFGMDVSPSPPRPSTVVTVQNKPKQQKKTKANKSPNKNLQPRPIDSLPSEGGGPSSASGPKKRKKPASTSAAVQGMPLELRQRIYERITELVAEGNTRPFQQNNQVNISVGAKRMRDIFKQINVEFGAEIGPDKKLRMPEGGNKGMPTLAPQLFVRMHNLQGKTISIEGRPSVASPTTGAAAARQPTKKQTDSPEPSPLVASPITSPTPTVINDAWAVFTENATWVAMDPARPMSELEALHAYHYSSRSDDHQRYYVRDVLLDQWRSPKEAMHRTFPSSSASPPEVSTSESSGSSRLSQVPPPVFD